LRTVRLATELLMDENFLVVLRARIDQHLRFFDTLERIRWQFTTAFGAGASAALFFAVEDRGGAKKTIALILVFGFSLAGLVAQIRIFALISVLWKRMLTLQANEFNILQERIKSESADLKKALSFPRLLVLDKRIFLILNVGMASCFLFSLLIGIAASLATAALYHSPLLSIASGATIGLFFAVMSLIGGKLYARAVEASDGE
jgi:hypothetical protein